MSQDKCGGMDGQMLSLFVPLIRTPAWIPFLFPKRIWRMREAAPVLYLTFDDGPTPGITEFVLDCLAAYQAKATFFCIGNNVRRHPELARRIAAEGHSIGNHTENHKNGWKTGHAAYLEDVAAGQASLQSVLGYGPGLFRPPYGKAGRRSARALLPHYQIVMWDVLAGDFYPKRSALEVTQGILKTARPGSLIVLHDSIKCELKVRHALPEVLRHFKAKGFTFAALPDPRQIQT